MNSEVLPLLDKDRETCVRYVADDPTTQWDQEFSLSFCLAEGAPARISAITQSLHQFRPNYIHILRPKSYRDESFLRTDGVQFLPFDKASSAPAMPVESKSYTGLPDIDERVMMVGGSSPSRRRKNIHFEFSSEGTSSTSTRS